MDATTLNGAEYRGSWPGGKAEPFSGLFNHTQVILLDGTDGELDDVVSVARGDGGGTAHDFRRVHSSPRDLQLNFLCSSQ